MTMIQLKLRRTCNWLCENGYTKKQEQEIYVKQLQDVYDNPRWYLDNLNYLVEYRVSWKCYSSKTPTLPYTKDIK